MIEYLDEKGALGNIAARYASVSNKTATKE
jgi:hypothetical protein